MTTVMVVVGFGRYCCSLHDDQSQTLTVLLSPTVPTSFCLSFVSLSLTQLTQVAAPMVVGMLAFGGRWDSLLGLDTTGMYPIRVAEDHAVHAAKKVRIASMSGGGVFRML